ncbi:uncharacterized protein EI90DRAFT_3153461 [Cantharellus anzutake]|uniref:uncharacterized protein n=1 Tax=Cantharellus anzutake TaxID=1750568 RepID=UPI001905876A|nr:uncharacterized protein EI90DRAFT_3153461 [Cantharellus anzutake]KAF8334105.1 hypothetical protein EI90DRAFT_3153461 [Cantharellus anzutake]
MFVTNHILTAYGPLTLGGLRTTSLDGSLLTTSSWSMDYLFSTVYRPLPPPNDKRFYFIPDVADPSSLGFDPHQDFTPLPPFTTTSTVLISPMSN